jgi:hypothetical protein
MIVLVDWQGAGTVEVSRFRCAVGSRVVLDTTSGVTLEAGLQFGPLSPLASTVLAALQSALKADAANAITAGALMADGFGSGIADTEWGALKVPLPSLPSSKCFSSPAFDVVTAFACLVRVPGCGGLMGLRSLQVCV